MGSTGLTSKTERGLRRDQTAEPARETRRAVAQPVQASPAAALWANAGPAIRLLPAASGSAPSVVQRIKDRSNKKVELENLSTAERTALLAVRRNLQANPKHANVLKMFENRISDKLGKAAVMQFFRGGHFVFNDGGTVYQQVRDYCTNEGVALKERRAANKETSHYTSSTHNAALEVNTPQLGVDLPGTGHILFGIVPNLINGTADAGSSGNTFVQTEMYGFQGVSDKVGHLWGWVVSKKDGLNSGLVGYSPHREGAGREIRESDQS